MNILIILLGSNILPFLLDRIKSTVDYVEKNYDSSTKITWFLSGGIKNPQASYEISEASIMKSKIEDFMNNPVHEFVLDERSTNTAENFIWASNYLNNTSQEFDSIYVSTSAFHFERANLMLNLIDPTKQYQWILSDLEEKDSRYWESIHINNIHNDIYKAKSKLFN
jgi:hypothetical protein